MKVTVIIPARYASQRFPGKLLKSILGKPIIQHVYERASESTFVDDVFVATDDNRIEEAVRAFKGKVILTGADHESGTDRLAEVANNLSSDIFINVQGDQPFISPKIVDQVASSLISDQSIEMASAGVEFKDLSDFLNPNVVKVLCDQQGFALFFSRLPMPFVRKLWKSDDHWSEFFNRYTLSDIKRNAVLKHLGIYAYRRDLLLRYSDWHPSRLEKEESLEQLRALEHGVRIKIIKAKEDSPSIDSPSDLDKLKSQKS